MIASQRGHTATAQLLVEAGADKEAKNKVRDCARGAFANRLMVRGGGGGGVEGDAGEYGWYFWACALLCFTRALIVVGHALHE